MSVIVLDNLFTGKLSNLRGSLSNAKFEFINADIRDKEALTGLVTVSILSFIWPPSLM
jgi:dTDP-D-glucose 4,6-dehydratase